MPVQEQIDGLKLRHAQEILELESKMDEAEKEISKWQVIASASHNHSRRSASPQFKGIKYAKSISINVSKHFLKYS